MNKAFVIILFSSLLLSGCTSQANLDELQTKYDKQVAENTKLMEENQKLTEENQKLTTVENENMLLKEKLLLYRNEDGVGEAKSNENNLVSSEEEEYMQNLIEVYDFNAKYFDSFVDGNVPGVTFKLRNRGTKTLSYVELTVYFKDLDGKIFAEERYVPINDAGFDDKYLKPNYNWQMDQDYFYRAESVPKEWKPGNAEYKVTKIEFEE